VHDPTGEDAAVAENTASFRTAVNTPFGLELKPSHTPISFLIVNYIERPSENEWPRKRYPPVGSAGMLAVARATIDHLGYSSLTLSDGKLFNAI